jgi:hypothetical protein
VIWLTTLEAARNEHPYNVYFIADDKGFGKPKLKPELASEAPNCVAPLTTTRSTRPDHEAVAPWMPRPPNGFR